MADLPVLAAPPVDVDLTDWLAACTAVRSFCRWHVAPVITDTYTLDGHGGCDLVLPTKRLLELTGVASDGDAVTDIEVSSVGLARRSWPGWSRKLGGVTVTMKHGYDTCPNDIVQVLTVMVQPTVPGAPASVQAGPFGVSFGQNSARIQAGAVGLSAEQKRALLPYRLEPSL